MSLQFLILLINRANLLFDSAFIFLFVLGEVADLGFYLGIYSEQLCILVDLLSVLLLDCAHFLG